MTNLRGGLLVLFLSGAAYANALGNGFAYDDHAILPQNPVVTQGDWREALSSPYQPDALEGAGLYRPVTSLSYVGEWRLFQGRPFGFHLVNLLLHGGVALLVFLLLLELAGGIPALVGGSLFAVHPVHTEAVANIVGRAEIYAALFYLAACLLYWKGRGWTGARRVPRLLGIGLLYLLSLGSKEIGVTLPLALLLLEALAPVLEGRGGARGEGEPRRIRRGVHVLPLGARLWRESGTFLLLLVVLLAYLGLRITVLGTLAGEVPAPVFRELASGERVLTAHALWSHYVRLLLFPAELAADYAPGVIFPAETVDLSVLTGVAVLLGLAWLTSRSLRARPPKPLPALGILFFVLTMIPVSNLLFPTGVLLAERTLYLPSVGLSMGVAGAAAWALGRRRPAPRLLLSLGVLILFALFTRTVLRNPSWMSTYTVLQTLNRDHPESHLAFLNRGSGLDRVGETEAAREQFSMALRLAPHRYGTLTEVAGFLGRAGEWREAGALLRRAIELAPSRDDAYRLLSAQLLRQGRGRDAHRVAAEGLAHAGFHGELWGALSESYVMRGDLAAALRARRAALAAEPDSRSHWARLAELLEAQGDEEAAEWARTEASARLGREGGGPVRISQVRRDEVSGSRTQVEALP